MQKTEAGDLEYKVAKETISLMLAGDMLPLVRLYLAATENCLLRISPEEWARFAEKGIAKKEGSHFVVQKMILDILSQEIEIR